MSITQQQLNAYAKTNELYRVPGKELGIKKIVTPDKIVYVGIWELYAKRILPPLIGFRGNLTEHDPHAIVGFTGDALLQQARNRILARYVEPKSIVENIDEFVKNGLENPFESKWTEIAVSQPEVTDEGYTYISWRIRNKYSLRNNDSANLNIPLWTENESTEINSKSDYQLQ